MNPAPSPPVRAGHTSPASSQKNGSTEETEKQQCAAADNLRRRQLRTDAAFTAPPTSQPNEGKEENVSENYKQAKRGILTTKYITITL